ncbi:MAG: DUF2089 domain-containing protein [Gammaproteobacteria bacterium]|nr:DUF2089 domain-containing protein [Gammaproteobacteria bacterium]MCY4143345.1 DUF2089 domain-containing protein [Gammaproteobacteria bacterium]
MNIGKAKCPNCSRDMNITRLVCADCNIRVEADFEMPALARLTPEDQLFVSAFVQNHGSIKQMERLFGVSYPTVKNRLVAISSKLDPIAGIGKSDEPLPSSEQTLSLLSDGEISVDEALRRLGQ